MSRLQNRLKTVRHAGDKDTGLTLTETIVSMGIVGLILAAASGMMLSSLRGNSLASGKTSSQADARLAVEYLSRDLRTAIANPIADEERVAIANASQNSITFYTAKNGASGDVYRIQYAIDATSKCLRRTATKYTAGAFPDSAKKSSCVVPGRVDTPSALFTYFPQRTSLATPPTPLAVPAGGITDTTDLQSIVGVRITLSLRASDRPDVAPTTAIQDVTLVNITK